MVTTHRPVLGLFDHFNKNHDSTIYNINSRHPEPFPGALIPNEPQIKQVSTSPVHSPLEPEPGTRSAVTPRSSARQREQPWSLSPVCLSSVHQILSSRSSFRSLTPLQAGTVQNWWSKAVREEGGGGCWGGMRWGEGGGLCALPWKKNPLRRERQGAESGEGMDGGTGRGGEDRERGVMILPWKQKKNTLSAMWSHTRTHTHV